MKTLSLSSGVFAFLIIVCLVGINPIILGSETVPLSCSNVSPNNQREYTNRTWYVDDNNTEGPWNGTLEHPYRYINDATRNASDYDTVFVFTGTYHEQVYMEKPTQLIGENKYATIIDGGGEQGSTVVCHANHITVKGFTITRSGDWANDAGVWIEDAWSHHSSYDTITDNIICRNNGDAIHTFASNYNMFTNNTFIDNAGDVDIGGIHTHNTFSNNILFNDSVSIGWSTGCHIDANIFHNGKLALYGDAGNIASNNTFIEGGALELTKGKHTIVNNSFIHAKGIKMNGDNLEDWTGYTIQGNTLDGRPIYYWCYHDNDTVPPDAAQVIAVDCHNVHIENLTMSGSFGITAFSCKTLIVAHNTLTDTDGISLLSSPDCMISSNNLFHGSVYIANSNNNQLIQNEILDGGIECYTCNQDRITGNAIRDTNSYGILIQGGTSNTISSNVISNTKVAVELLSTWMNSILENDFLNSSSRHAYFISDGFAKSYNTWRNNFWEGRSGLSPVPILGRFNTHIFIPSPGEGYGHYLYLPMINVDWSPSRNPHSD